MTSYLRMFSCVLNQPIFTAPPRDLSGQTIVVTGPTIGGIGYETARLLASFNATVILAARNPTKAHAAADAIRSAHPSADVHHTTCDLSSLASVADFHKQLQTLAPGGVDVLVCNAGMQTGEVSTNADGVELTFAVCVLGHHYLIHLLRPRRLVWVSGDAYCTARGMPDPWVKESGHHAYARASLGRLLLAREWKKKGGMAVVAVHPGVINTNIGDFGAVMGWLFERVAVVPEQGAQVSVLLASCAEEELEQDRGLPYYHNKYGWYDFGKGDMALDKAEGEKLFETCNELAGIVG